MKIALIEMEGFRGVRSHQRINVPSGFLVITGRNGAGKSTVCDAVEFALSGRISKYDGAKESGEATEQYVWWRGLDQPENRFVRIKLIDGDREVTITRTPEGQTVSGAEDLAAAVCDVRIVAGNPLEELCRTAIIRDESIAALSIDLQEERRFAFVRAALGTEFLDAIAERRKPVLLAMKKRTEAARTSYERGREDLSALLESLAEARANVKEIPNLEIALGTIRRVVGDFGDQRRIVIRARERLAQSRARADALAKLAQDLENVSRERRQIDEALTGKQRLLSEQSRLNNEVSALRQSDLRPAGAHGGPDGIQTRRAHLAMLAEAGAALGRRHDGTCPLCASEVSNEAFEEAIKVLRSEVDAEDQRLAQERAIREQTAQRIERLQEELAAIAREIGRIDRLRDDVNSKEAEVAAAAKLLIALEPPASVSGVVQAIEELKNEQTELAEALLVVDASQTVERISELERRVEEARERSNALERACSDAEQAEARAKALLASIRRTLGEVAEERLASLGPLLKDLYRRLRPHADWMDVTYRVRGEIKKYLSLRVGDDVNPKFTFSSGQRRAIGLAFLLAVHLSRPWSRLKTLVLDDPVQHIDDFRSLHLVEVLSAIHKQGHQVICAVEDEALADLMCRRIGGLREPGQGLLVRMAYKKGKGVGIDRAEEIMPLTPRLVLYDTHLTEGKS